jgi:hypothetical protein
VGSVRIEISDQRFGMGQCSDQVRQSAQTKIKPNVQFDLQRIFRTKSQKSGHEMTPCVVLSLAKKRDRSAFDKPSEGYTGNKPSVVPNVRSNLVLVEGEPLQANVKGSLNSFEGVLRKIER